MKKRLYRSSVNINRRVFFIFVITILLFCILFIKITQVMIIDQSKYNLLLKQLSYKDILGESTPRGRILDRNYKVIVDNKPVNTIVFKNKYNLSNKKLVKLAYKVSKYLDIPYKKVSERSKREYCLYKRYSDITNILSKDDIRLYKSKKIKYNDLYDKGLSKISDDIINSMSDRDIKASYLFYLMRNGYSYNDKVIKFNCSDYEFTYISLNASKLDGFDIRVDWERSYPYGDVMRSILGNVSGTSGIPIDLKSYYIKHGYSLNDRVGVSYLELVYDKYLKGYKNKYSIISSSSLKLIEPGRQGNDIVLTIDIDLQREVESIISSEIIRTKSETNSDFFDSSTVILEDKTGGILVMASKKLINGKIVDNLSNMIMSPVTPGSVVKGASILVGYNNGAIKIGERMEDKCIKINGAKEKCSFKTLGNIDDIMALARSSNIYQFKTAIRVNGQEYSPNMRMIFKQESFDKYRKMYRSFGLGSSTGIDLPRESIGYSSKDINPGNLLDFVIGQYETYTPLQLSQYINTISNGGTRYSLHLLKEVRSTNSFGNIGSVIYTYQPKVLNKVSSDPIYMERMRRGFYAVMHPGGYGRGYINENFSPAGKTGTSQSFIDTDLNGIIDRETITSSFVGFFPYEDPSISIVCVAPNVSYPNNSSDYMSPITKRITRRVTDTYYNVYKNVVK